LVVTVDSMEANGENLRAVLKGLNLSEYAELLEREDLDLDILAEDVKEEQLERIGVKTLGQRLKILGAAKKAVRCETGSKSAENPEVKLPPEESQEKVERDDATETVIGGKTDDGKRKESKERKLEGNWKEIKDKTNDSKNDIEIEDKSEIDPETSSGGEGFLAKSKETPEDDSRKGTEESQKGTENKSKKENEDNNSEKSETFLKNQKKASTGGRGFSKTTLKDSPPPDKEWKSPFKSSSDSAEDSTEGMSTTGGLLYTAALTALKMMEAK